MSNGDGLHLGYPEFESVRTLGLLTVGFSVPGRLTTVSLHKPITRGFFFDESRLVMV